MRRLGCRAAADERRGPGRIREVKRTAQLERESQGRAAQPVVSAEKLAERRRRDHSMAIMGPLKYMAVTAGTGSVHGTQKRRCRNL